MSVSFSFPLDLDRALEDVPSSLRGRLIGGCDGGGFGGELEGLEVLLGRLVLAMNQQRKGTKQNKTTQPMDITAIFMVCVEKSQISTTKPTQKRDEATTQPTKVQ